MSIFVVSRSAVFWNSPTLIVVPDLFGFSLGLWVLFLEHLSLSESLLFSLSTTSLDQWPSPDTCLSFPDLLSSCLILSVSRTSRYLYRLSLTCWITCAFGRVSVVAPCRMVSCKQSRPWSDSCVFFCNSSSTACQWAACPCPCQSPFFVGVWLSHISWSQIAFRCLCWWFTLCILTSESMSQLLRPCRIEIIHEPQVVDLAVTAAESITRIDVLACVLTVSLRWQTAVLGNLLEICLTLYPLYQALSRRLLFRFSSFPCCSVITSWRCLPLPWASLILVSKSVVAPCRSASCIPSASFLLYWQQVILVQVLMYAVGCDTCEQLECRW